MRKTPNEPMAGAPAHEGRVPFSTGDQDEGRRGGTSPDRPGRGRPYDLAGSRLHAWAPHGGAEAPEEDDLASGVLRGFPPVFVAAASSRFGEATTRVLRVAPLEPGCCESPQAPATPRRRESIDRRRTNSGPRARSGRTVTPEWDSGDAGAGEASQDGPPRHRRSSRRGWNGGTAAPKDHPSRERAGCSAGRSPPLAAAVTSRSRRRRAARHPRSRYARARSDPSRVGTSRRCGCRGCLGAADARSLPPRWGFGHR